MRPIGAAFICFGVFWGAWAVAAVDVERFLGASHLKFGVLFAVGIVAGSVTNATGGAMAERLGVRRAQAWSLVVWGAAVLGAAATRGRALFAALFVLVVAAGGAVDVVMNVSATAALGEHPGRLMRFHSLFNSGSLVGAAATGLLLRAGASWRWSWLAIGLGAWAVGTYVWVADVPAGPPGDSVGVLHALGSLRSSGLFGLAAIFAGAALVEGGIDTWGVLYLRSNLKTTIVVGTGAFVVGQVLATLARATLGPLAEASRGRGASIGAGLAAVGLLVEAVARVPALSAAGLAIATVGASMTWPLLLAGVSSTSERLGVVVGGVTAAGYLGFVAGPPIVGALSSAFGLRWGLGFMAAAAAVVAVAAAPARERAAPVSQGRS